MTSDTAWIEKARRLLADGMPVALICQAICKSETAVRFHLNINGRADKKRAANAAAFAGGTGHVVSRRVKEPRADKAEKPAAIGRYELRPVTLPMLAFLSKPIDEPPPAARRIAPKPHCLVEPAGVSVWRNKHRELIRSGRIAEPGMALELL